MHNTHAPPSIDRHIHVLSCRPGSVNVARRTDSDGCLCARVRARRQLPREHALRDVGLDVWTRIARPRWAEMIGGRVGANAAARGPDAVVASSEGGQRIDPTCSLLGLGSECLRRRDGSSCATGRGNVHRRNLTSARAGGPATVTSCVCLCSVEAVLGCRSRSLSRSRASLWEGAPVPATTAPPDAAAFERELSPA